MGILAKAEAANKVTEQFSNGRVSLSLSGMWAGTERRFTFLSHSLTVDATSRSSMVATLFGFSVIMARGIQFG